MASNGRPPISPKPAMLTKSLTLGRQTNEDVDGGYSEIGSAEFTAFQQRLPESSKRIQDNTPSQSKSSANREQYAQVRKTKSHTDSMAEVKVQTTRIDLYLYDYIAYCVAKPKDRLPLTIDGTDLKSRRKVDLDLSRIKNGDKIKQYYNMYSATVAVTSVKGVNENDIGECLNYCQYRQHKSPTGLDIVHLKKDKKDIDESLRILTGDYEETCLSVGSLHSGDDLANFPTIMSNAQYYEGCFNTSSATVCKEEPKHSTKRLKPPLPPRSKSFEGTISNDGASPEQNMRTDNEKNWDGNIIPPYHTTKLPAYKANQQKINSADKVCITHESKDSPQILIDDSDTTTIPPYCTTKINRDFLYSKTNDSNDNKSTDSSDSDDYEPVEFVDVPKNAFGITISKQMYNFICMFESFDPSDTYSTCEVNDRNIEVVFKNEDDCKKFTQIQERLDSELVVEGVKIDGDKMQWQNKLQSDFKCIWSIPDDQSDVIEILCKKEDSDAIKEAIQKQGNSDVFYIYEKAKEPEKVIISRTSEPVDQVSCGFVIGDKQLFIHVTDITRMRVTAIVNAANSHLSHGGGVAKAIRIAGGKKLVESSKEYIAEHGPVLETNVARTDSGKLPCKFVLHAVGPQWPSRGSSKQNQCINKLKHTYVNILKKADEEKCESVALPPVSSGKYRVPLEHVTSTMAQVLLEELPKKTMCSAVHIVDVKDDILVLLQRALLDSDKARSMPPVEVKAGIKGVLGELAGKTIVPKKKKHHRYRIEFSK